MAIKMRNNKELDSVCCECGDHRKDVLDMFDLCIGGNVLTICDVCNEQILSKTLRAECSKNARIKTPQDMAVMRKRANGSYSYKFKYNLEREEKRQASEKGEDK